MNNVNQPAENPTENQNPPKNFGSQFLAITNAKWFLVGVVLLACTVLYAISASSRGLWPFPSPKEKVVLTPLPSSSLTPEPSFNGEFCIQVITPARNPQTREIKDFPTPCDVPEGWEVIQ